MLNGDYIRHNVLFAMELLMAGISSDNKQLLMRATLNTLEMLLRNVNNQMKCGVEDGHEAEFEPQAA